jgi:hypothetical protein
MSFVLPRALFLLFSLISVCWATFKVDSTTTTPPDIGGEITLTGDDFFGDLTGVTYGATPCINVNIIDVKHVSCTLPPGYAKTTTVTVTRSGAGTVTNSLNAYNPPKLTFIAPATLSSNLNTFTLFGKDFGPAPGPGNAILGSALLDVQCSTSKASPTLWMAVCNNGKGTPPRDGVPIDVAFKTSVTSDISDSMKAAFVWEWPAITAISSPLPTAGSGKMEIRGQFLNTAGLSVAVSVGSVPCVSLALNTNTRFTCNDPPSFIGTGAGLPVTMVVTDTVLKKTFTMQSPQLVWYIPPTISSLTPKNGPPSGGNMVTIDGSGFGTMTTDGAIREVVFGGL